MSQVAFLFLAFLFVFCFPSANLQLFDGLPLSRLYEFGALALVIPFLIFPDLRNRQIALWNRLKIRPVFLWVLLAAVLLIKGILLASGTHSGFSACYRSPAEPTAITHEELPPHECERSYENLLNRFSATRLDASLWFTPDTWNLVFLNTNRYNYYDWDPGNILRARIPLKAEWSGTPDVSPGDAVRIEYVGEGTVAWGGLQIPLPPSYAASNVVEFSPPPANASLRIDYTFNDGSRSGQDPQDWGPRATFKVSTGKPGHMVPLTAAAVDPGWRVLGFIADALIILWLLSCLPAFWNSVRRDLLPLVLFSIVIGIFALLPGSPLFREIGITAALAAFLIAHLVVRPFRFESVYAAVIASGFAILHVWTSGVGQVLLRSAGNDPLDYASNAYSILYMGSLQGGESVFDSIPMYRYIKFLEHVFFGDGDVLYAAVQLAAFFGGVFWLFRTTAGRVVPVVRKILLVILGCSLIFLGGYYVSTVIRDGLSEYDTWILLLWALPALYWQSSSTAIISGTVALAISCTIRPNQVPGILWILFLAAIGSWRNHTKTVLLAGALAIGIALLPLLHNLCFGHQWVLLTSGRELSFNLTLQPSTWLAFLMGDPSARQIIWNQMGMMFLVTDVSPSLLPILMAMALPLMIWTLMFVHTIIRREKNMWGWLVVPLVYLAPHLFYVINNYYPRHIVAAYLSMAIVAALVLMRNLPAVPSAAEPAVELPRT